MFEKREKVYRQWLLKLNQSNGISGALNTEICHPDKPGRSLFNYKYIIGRGNNSILIRMCLKQRWWWTKGSWEDFNFIWTQSKSKIAMEEIKPNKK